HRWPVFGFEGVAQDYIGGNGFAGLLRKTLAIHFAVNSHSEKADLIADDTGHWVRRGVGEILNADAATTATAAFFGRAFRQGELLVVIKVLLEELAVGEEVEEGEAVLVGSALA